MRWFTYDEEERRERELSRADNPCYLTGLEAKVYSESGDSGEECT